MNPIFGQGLSKCLWDNTGLTAAFYKHREAIHWDGKLPRSFSTDYFKLAQRTTLGMWDMTRKLDYGYSTTEPIEGETLELGEWFRNYWAGVLKLMPNVSPIDLLRN